MSANNQTLVKEHEGKFYVFKDINAEAWDEGHHELKASSADFVSDSRDEAFAKAIELDGVCGQFEEGTEYGVQFNRLCKDDTEVYIVP